MIDYSWDVLIFKIILPACWASLKMMAIAGVLAGIAGFAVAIVLFLSNKGGLRENLRLYKALNLLISFARSFPFVILMVAIIPITRLVAGTSIGWTAALVPLTIAGIPYMARLYENSLREVDTALIDAARSWGASDLQIVFRVVVIEATPSLISGSVFSAIHMLNLTAIAGAIGAGGLGASALEFGYQVSNDKAMYSIVAVLVAWVILIQFLGDLIYKRFK